MTDKATQVSRIQELRDECDHLFLSVEEVKRYTEPFGFVGSTFLAKANPHKIKGLTLDNGATEAEGQDAATVAEEIAVKLDPNFGQIMNGRGSRLRFACAAALKSLESVPA